MKIRGQLLYNEPMSRHTSLKVGGAADLYAIPADADDLQQLVSYFQEHEIPWIAIGKGYNLLVRDKGFRGGVISLERFQQMELAPDGRLTVGAGVENLAAVRYAQQHGWGGIGFMCGIPGTVGGAVRMNAGAYGQGILQHTACLTLLRDGEVREFCMDQLKFGYRHLELQAGDLVLAAVFVLHECDPACTEEEIKKDLELRRSKHNVGYPSAGSFFKNPSGEVSWRLIDAAGMRGAQVGGAQVSPVHSNFLVNTGGATADDFFTLASRVKNAVFQTSGVTLEEEVRIVGEI